VTVTRTQLANHIEAAFASGVATRDRLLAYAAGSHARPAVIALIRSLPDRAYPDTATPMEGPGARPRRPLEQRRSLEPEPD
jgi:Protein of unknown function (DUF2795)